MKEQSGQVGKMQSILEEKQKTQSTLVNVMTRIQDHVILDGDQDKTSCVDEKPPVSESIPSQAEPSREPLERLDMEYGQLESSAPYCRSF